MAEKLFYSMGEVAEMFDVNPSLLRHWETQFPVLRPKRNKKGNRLYTPADVERLKLIYHLVKECGMTLEGARKALRQARGSGHVPRDMELLERLQRVRAMLAEVRAELLSDADEIVAEEIPPTDAADDAVRPVEDASVAVSEGSGPAEALRGTAAQEAGAAVSDDAAEAKGRKPRRKAVVKIEEPKEDAAAAAEAAAAAPAGKKRPQRRPRRKKEDAEHKELFAFYEQSLF